MKNIVNKIVLFGITINCLSFVNMTLFQIYSKVCYYLNFGIIVLVLAIYFQQSLKLGILKKYLFILLFFFYLLISLLISSGGIGSTITIIYSLLVYLMYMYTNFKRNDYKYLFGTFFMLSLFIFFRSFGYLGKFSSNVSEYINTNTMGMMAFFSLIYNMIFYKYLYKKNQVFFSTLQIFLCTVSMINYECRGSLLAMSFFVFFFSFYPKKIWTNKRFVIVLFLIIVFIGTLFPFVYSNMYMNKVYFEIPFLNKGLYTGREIIWINAIKQFGNEISKWLMGIGSNAVVWEKNMNLHNNYFAVITNFGFVGYSLYYGFFLYQIRKTIKNMNKMQIDLLIGIFSILLLSYVEIVTLWETMFLVNLLVLGLFSNVHFKKNVLRTSKPGRKRRKFIWK